MTRSDLVLGVDGGGSRTRVWLALLERPEAEGILGQGTAEGSNPRTMASSTAVRNIDQAVQAAFDDARIARRCVTTACISLAGADREDEQEPIRRWSLDRNVAEQVIVTNDAIPILYAKNPSGIGVALIAGTGSVAWGRNTRGETCRSGGWGPTFGDEGSGYAIACAGLRAAAGCADRRGPPTDLLARFQAHFQTSVAIDLIPKIYAEGFGRPEIARLASIVFESESQGDPVAAQILDRAADDLAICTESVACRLGLTTRDWVLSMSGGVLLNQASLRRRLLRRLGTGPWQPREMVEVDQPVAGAVRLAALSDSSGLPSFAPSTG